MFSFVTLQLRQNCCTKTWLTNCLRSALRNASQTVWPPVGGKHRPQRNRLQKGCLQKKFNGVRRRSHLHVHRRSPLQRWERHLATRTTQDRAVMTRSDQLPRNIYRTLERWRWISTWLTIQWLMNLYSQPDGWTLSTNIKLSKTTLKYHLCYVDTRTK